MPHEAFILLGDALWLDFVNTARGRTAYSPDLLPDADALPTGAPCNGSTAAPTRPRSRG
jgi:hypothetical protein